MRRVLHSSSLDIRHQLFHARQVRHSCEERRSDAGGCASFAGTAVPCQRSARSSTRSADPERADPEQHMLLSEGSSSRKHEHLDIVTPKTAEVAT